MAKCEFTCGWCESQFASYHERPYCSRECYRSAQRSGLYQTGSSIKNTCTECGSIFEGRRKTRKRNGEEADKIFCSRECYDIHRANIIRQERTAECLNCGKVFTRLHTSSGKYCSMACRVAYKKPDPCHCVNCGAWFTAIKCQDRGGKIRITAVSNAKTCSPECRYEWRSADQERKRKISEAFQADKHPNWQGGSHYGRNRGPGWHKIAERCRDRHGRKCADCGMSETDSIAKGWGRLQVNHKIPFHQWRDKRKANAQSNLEALCKSCHTRIDWQWRKENPVQMSLSIFR